MHWGCKLKSIYGRLVSFKEGATVLFTLLLTLTASSALAVTIAECDADPNCELVCSAETDALLAEDCLFQTLSACAVGVPAGDLCLAENGPEGGCR